MALWISWGSKGPSTWQRCQGCVVRVYWHKDSKIHKKLFIIRIWCTLCEAIATPCFFWSLSVSAERLALKMDSWLAANGDISRPRNVHNKRHPSPSSLVVSVMTPWSGRLPKIRHFVWLLVSWHLVKLTIWLWLKTQRIWDGFSIESSMHFNLC